MGYQSDYATTERIPLGNPKYWVEIKRCLSRGELKKAEKLLADTTISVAQDGAQSAQLTPDVSAYRDHMVTSSIVAWNLDDDNGQILPITPDTVAILAGDDFDRIWERVDILNGPDGPEERRRFPAGGVGSDPAGEGGAAEPADVPAGARDVEAAGAAPGGPRADAVA